MSITARWLRSIPLALALFAPAVGAQEGRGDVVYVPTPQVVVDEMLRMAKVGENDFIIDLGSGDGRIVITAAKKYGARGFGVDLDKYLLKLANAGAQKEGVADRARFIEQNLFETDLSQATVISSYLLPEMNLRLRPTLLKLKPGTRVVAHDYSMGQWDADQQKTLIVPEKTVGDPGKSYIYLYIVPAHVAGTWESQLLIGGRTVPYVFNFDQEFQEVTGQVRVGDGEVKLPEFKVNGDLVSFNFTATVGGAPVTHRFRGWVKGNAIEGNVTVGGEAVGQRVIPWTAKQTRRGEMRMGNDGVAAADGK
jgi:16S rRNA G966 N2-methylase RsmD